MMDCSKPRMGGFTLIELMITVAIMAILAAIAVPIYSDYTRRAKVAEAASGLSAIAVKLNAYYDNHRTYQTGSGSTACSASGSNFRFSCTGDATTFTATATGLNSMAGFTYTLDQSGIKTSTTPWGNSNNCWVSRKGGSC
jgi:type IV pilus assembly protein PilE